MKPKCFDMIELTENIPDKLLRKGEHGAIVEVFGNDDYLVEFCNSFGETTALETINSKYFEVVWVDKSVIY